jgi:L-ribulose-5-phosphate 3-epimerase
MHNDRLTIITDEVSQNFDEVGEFLKEYSLGGFELRSMEGRAFKDLTQADIAKTRRFARDNGWQVYGCATPVFKCAIDDLAAGTEHVECFKRSLEKAIELNCDLLRVFTFTRPAIGEPDAALIERAAERLQPLLELIENTPVRLGVENELSCIVATAEEVRSFLGHFESDRLGVIWDPCNILYLNGEPVPPATQYAAIQSRVFHVHVKDAWRTPGSAAGPRAIAAPVGLGDVGWKTHLGEIIRGGFNGKFSLETHWRIRALDERLLHLPAGHDFSAGGLEASRVCLRNLQALMGAPG